MMFKVGDKVFFKRDTELYGTVVAVKGLQMEIAYNDPHTDAPRTTWHLISKVELA